MNTDQGLQLETNEKVLFCQNESSSYKVTLYSQSVEYVLKLVESGFEYVCEVNDVKVFTKP